LISHSIINIGFLLSILNINRANVFKYCLYNQGISGIIEKKTILMKQWLGKLWLRILPSQHQTSPGQITINIHLLSLIFGVNGDCDVHYCLCNGEVLGQRRQESTCVIVVQCKISNLRT
jgi:hypothetical protein